MEGIDFANLLSSVGVAAPFIWYLVTEKAKDREEARLRRKSDVRLALALERFVQTTTGRSFVIPAEEGDDVQ